MRDLYRRLGIAPNASQDDIRDAIARCSHAALRQDATRVLGDERCRSEYDALYTTLSDLGRLRARLGLTHAPFWRDGLADDFSLPSDTRGSHHDALRERLMRAVTLHDRWQRLGGVGITVLTLTSAMIGAALTAWWL
ncbi:hypothetical protein [Halomonas urumqiensis]|uniref:J domain-containing protein n=1 Tax=Halomonas urumqiensis TaxID=1684789 RepID=A0A2N7UD68_9GAMM|nr:hypothetical protein [Halomonas urumqiensis]PMR78406.1 hypothetical protein C1H70_16810 [Halomonas urumqiensis]PTB03552.1 hypothetical protein C6V82_03445 [Halomonas urumqiensis]GHE20246.1 hypothetical protein GCM10017767_07670 [Halomonas urumqiensis]